MSNLLLQLPMKLRTFSASSSSNGSSPGVPQLGGPHILEIPLDKIRRPLMRTKVNDPQKVKDLMESIHEIGLQVPIDVLEVDGQYYGKDAYCRNRQASPAAIDMKHTSNWGCRRFAAKFDVGQRKL